MARRIILKEGGISNIPKPPIGYKYIGYDDDKIASQKTGDTIIPIDINLCETAKNCDWFGTITNELSTPNLLFIKQKSDLPDPVGGIITLQDNFVYYFIADVDLTGDRIVTGENSTIIGGSNEIAKIRSTGLSSGALITSTTSLPLRDVTLISPTTTVEVTSSVDNIDWYNVRIEDSQMGTITGVKYVFINNCQFINSTELTFDGAIDDITIKDSTISGESTDGLIIVPNTCTLNGLFRLENSRIISDGFANIGINFRGTVQKEGFRLENNNFIGSFIIISTILSDEYKLWEKNVGLENDVVRGHMRLVNNSTATSITSTDTFVKIAGTYSSTSNMNKVEHNSGRLSVDTNINRTYLVQVSLNFENGSNDTCSFALFTNSGQQTIGTIRATQNGSNPVNGITLHCYVRLSNADWIEVHCANNSTISDITVTDMLVTFTEIG